jgi:hypothetical protein
MLVVTGNVVNVRFGPSTNTRIRQQIPRDQQVMELQREGDWVRVEIVDSSGREGWIHGSLLAPPGGEPLVAAAPEDGDPVAQATPAEPAATIAQPGVGGPEETDVAATRPGEVAVIDPAITGSQATRPAVGRPAEAAPSEPAGIAPAAAPASTVAADLARFKQSVDYLNSRAVSVAGVDLFTDVDAAAPGVVQVAATDAWSSIPPAGQQSYANTLLDRWAAARGYGGPVSVQIVDDKGKVLLESTREQ